MELRSVLVLSVFLALLVTTASGRRFKEWRCHHNGSTGPVRHVHLAPVHRPLHHLKERALDQRFRIFVYYDSSVSQSLSPSVQTRLKGVVSNLVTFYESTLRVRPTEAPIIFDRDCLRGTYYIFNQPPVRRCQFSCTTTMCGEVQIPDQHLRACSACYGGSSSNCQTTGSDGPGVRNTDFVLYVSAVNTATCAGSTIAYASNCHQEDSFDRPIAGHANFCPSKISAADATDDFILAVAKHELLHALAFSKGLYAFWRDENGNPRTPRDERGLPPRSSTGYVASTSTLRTVTYTNWQTRNGQVSHSVTKLVTPRIVAEGRRHFNCPTLDGVEVENQGGSGTALSHWEKRILENEGMTGIVSPNPVFSMFTFALLDDSGWYRVDYSKAQVLVWGKNAGCDFSSGSCGGYIQNKQESGSSISPFCNRLNSVSPQLRGCTLDRTAISQCSLARYTTSLPTEYQYFNYGENFGGSTGVNIDVSTVGGDQIPDFCPYEKGFSNGDCTDTSNQRTGANNGFAETYAAGSRCVEHNGPWTAGRYRFGSYGSGCYQYKCSNGQVTLYVLGKGYVCSSAGETINVDTTVAGIRYQGTLVCPSCTEICYDDFNGCPAAAQMYAGFNSALLAASNPNAAASLTPLLVPILLVGAALLTLLL